MVTIYGMLVNQIEQGNIQIDSDLEDFANEHCITTAEAHRLFATYVYKNTSCVGCIHIADRLRPGLHTKCSRCTRDVVIHDFYAKEQ